MSTSSSTVDQQDSMRGLDSDAVDASAVTGTGTGTGSGTAGDTVSWSVGGERRTASLRIVRRDGAQPSRPGDPAVTWVPAGFGTSSGQPTRISDRRGRRPSARTGSHTSRQAA